MAWLWKNTWIKNCITDAITTIPPSDEGFRFAKAATETEWRARETKLYPAKLAQL